LDKIERDDAEVGLVVPTWPCKMWWNRIHAGSWRARVGTAEALPARLLEPYKAIGTASAGSDKRAV